MAVQWQVRHSARGALWRDFPEKLNEQTEDHYVNFMSSSVQPGVQRGVVYPWQDSNGEWVEYEINFDTMEQTNLRTGMKRPVRRIVLS